MKLLWVLLVLPLVLTLPNPSSAQTAPCEVRVFHTGNVVQGSRVSSHWLVGHSPWRWATVSFRYQITYVDENNREGKVAGRFRELIRGGQEEYVEIKNLRRHPAQIIRTKVSEISCQK